MECGDAVKYRGIMEVVAFTTIADTAVSLTARIPSVFIDQEVFTREPNYLSYITHAQGDMTPLTGDQMKRTVTLIKCVLTDVIPTSGLTFIYFIVSLKLLTYYELYKNILIGITILISTMLARANIKFNENHSSSC